MHRFFKDNVARGSSSFHLNVTNDGIGLKVKEVDLFEVYGQIADYLNDSIPFDKCGYISIESNLISDNVVVLVVSWYDKNRLENELVILPAFSGCFPVYSPASMDDVVDVMNLKIDASQEYEPNTILVSIRPLFLEVDSYTLYEEVNGGISFGSTNCGGPGWMYSGPNTPSICFPDHWSKFYSTRSWLMQDIPQNSSTRFVIDEYSWGAQPPQPPLSACYPLIRYFTQYRYKLARVVSTQSQP